MELNFSLSSSPNLSRVKRQTGEIFHSNAPPDCRTTANKESESGYERSCSTEVTPWPSAGYVDLKNAGYVDLKK